MCGIVGLLGRRPAGPLLLDGLKRLEYRGYDSAGVATLADGKIERRRAEGKIARLEAVVTDQPVRGTIGIGHTRWATHGKPNEVNAHPHVAHGIAVVHNGIIENYRALKRRLIDAGHRFETETDTEVVPHLIAAHRAAGLGRTEATARAFAELDGAYALVVLFEDDPELLMAARKGSPLAIGYGDGEMYVGSDATALAPLTDRIQYLEEGDWAIVREEGATVFDVAGREVSRPIGQTAFSGALMGKGNFRHFMEKEIHEQPAVLGDTLHAFGIHEGGLQMPRLPFDPAALRRLHVVACGTASLAGMVGKYWFERLAKLPVEWDIASEFRYRDAPLAADEAALFISQSGETADTLACLRLCNDVGMPTVAVVNVPESSIAREASGVLRTLAGPEIGVASTKAFTTQLATLACLALAAGRARGALAEAELAAGVEALATVPGRVREALGSAEATRVIAEHFGTVRDLLYLGRGINYPIALEGALKLKEITYIHAEGYAAGELKHGPIALVDEHTPVVVVAPFDDVFAKTASNVQEVVARGGRVLLVTDARGRAELADVASWVIEMPSVPPLVAPIVYAIPLQLLAYHVAVWRGTDVDQPRNLAKSVTVE
mgnify:CR=1 FL=1